jgi:hypothetical protein
MYRRTALDVFKAIQAGLGYEIPGAGFARVQFVGNNQDPHAKDTISSLTRCYTQCPPNICVKLNE